MTVDLVSCVENGENFFISSSEEGNIFVSKYSVPNSKGTVIIIPPYGRTTHDSLLITANLLVNHFNVLRFDSRNHVGMSSGEISHYKLSTLENDLMDLLSQKFIEPEKPIILLGISLSAPVAWKVAGRDAKIDGVVTLVGAVDVVSTVEKAGNLSLSPYFSAQDQGELYQEVFGFRIFAQDFVDDLIAYQFAYLNNINADIARINCPLFMIAAENDSWVSLDQVKEVINLPQKNRALLILKNCDHELGQSASIAKQAATSLVDYCKEVIGDKEETIVPVLTNIIYASTLESEKFSRLIPQNFQTVAKECDKA